LRCRSASRSSSRRSRSFLQQAIFTPRNAVDGQWDYAECFFDVGYRIAAIALGYSCGRQVWFGLVERKIKSFNARADVLDWLLDWSRSQVFERDAAPIQYWMEIGFQTFVTVTCLFAAIIGRWQPNT